MDCWTVGPRLHRMRAQDDLKTWLQVAPTPRARGSAVLPGGRRQVAGVRPRLAVNALSTIGHVLRGGGMGAAVLQAARRR